MQPGKGLIRITEALYLLLFISVVFSFRAVTSLSIALLIVTGIARNFVPGNSLLYRDLRNSFLYSCTLLFLCYLLTLIYTGNKQEDWSDIQEKIGLLFVPLAVCCTNFTDRKTIQRLAGGFVLIVIIGSVYCMMTATYGYFKTGDSSLFFYHSLVRPVNGHAIYFSVLVYIALLFLARQLTVNNIIRYPVLPVSGIVFLSSFLFLLSSKLVLIFYVFYLFVFFIHLIKRRPSFRILSITALVLAATAVTIALTIPNPVSRRFTDTINGNLRILRMEKFNQGMYFNGVQFRLLQWRFTSEILDDNHGWLTGVGPGNAQKLLNQKYILSDMYTGHPSRGDHGFIGYNTHNQFLETLLKTGLTGLVALLFVCFILIRIAIQKKHRETGFIIGLLLVWLFSEAVLERQYGILIFTFFPLFMLIEEK